MLQISKEIVGRLIRACLGFRIQMNKIITLHPSHVNAPKWNPAAGSPQTLQVWFIWKKTQNKKININFKNKETIFETLCGFTHTHTISSAYHVRNCYSYSFVNIETVNIYN